MGQAAAGSSAARKIRAGPRPVRLARGRGLGRPERADQLGLAVTAQKRSIKYTEESPTKINGAKREVLWPASSVESTVKLLFLVDHGGHQR